MTMSARTLRAVVAARTHLRNAAAAAEAAASSHHAHATAGVVDAHNRLDRTIDSVRDQLPAMTSVYQAERLADEITGDRALRADAERARVQAAAGLARSNVELRRQARNLRSIERALDVHIEAREASQDREEQRMCDDLSARPRGV